MSDVITAPHWPSAPPSVRDVLTEAGAAERFARIQADAVRFDHARGRWLLWSGHRWTPDDDGSIVRSALDTVRDWQREALELPEREQRERTLKFTLALERRAGLTNLLEIAKHLEPLADAGTAWDLDPFLLGVRNGIVDLRTGTLRPGRRDDRITMQTAVPFDAAARCPRWTAFLREVFADDDRVVAFVHRALGYSLTGDVREQCVFLNYGIGANGKSTLLSTVAFVLGDYSWSMPFSTIELQQRQPIPNDLAALAGRRFVVASETNDGTRLNESRLKALTGGDPISARFLHAEFFVFYPCAKFWLGVNHRPLVRDDSSGFWRRMRVIPFTRTFPVNATLFEELRAEGAGILAWAVRGALEWHAQRLQPPDTITAATSEYQRDSDPLDEFLETACERDPAAEVSAAEMFEHYAWWAKRVGLSERERLSATTFGRKLSERFSRAHTRQGKVYQGLARRPQPDVFSDGV